MNRKMDQGSSRNSRGGVGGEDEQLGGALKDRQMTSSVNTWRKKKYGKGNIYQGIHS